jgi:ankyrin repeat protein
MVFPLPTPTMATTQATNLISFSNMPRRKFSGEPNHNIRKQRSSITDPTHRSSIFTNYTSNDGNSLGSTSLGERDNNNYSESVLPDVHVLRRTNNDGTAPTMFSVVSRSDRSSNRSNIIRADLSTNPSRKSNTLLRFLKHGRRRKQLSEAQLRKQIKKHCEDGNWSRVRKLISNHDFTEIPDAGLETNSVLAKSSSSEGKQGSSKSSIVEPVQNGTSRRPSYGSRNGERLSFTGKESAAAAAVIKAAAAAALLEESSASEECTYNADIACDENILHDVCSYHPPRDVVELLLVAMRHRVGSTCSRDENGRTPLHVAVASGASSGVIDALTLADPLPATMGDEDKRSPLHLAVKFLAYDERYNINPIVAQATPKQVQSKSQ